jgi:ADP-heptose:LPS heptosyltransferase
VLVDREGLGDALLKLPFLRAIARGFPGRPIWWLATHQTAMEDDLKPWVSTLLERVVSHADLTQPVRAVVPRLRRLPAFELVFDTRTRVMTVLAARMFLRHRGFYACLPGFALSDRPPPGRWTRPRGIAARALSMAEAALGGPVDWRGTLDAPPAAQELAARLLPAGPRYVGLAPGSREARKNWPLDSWIALAGKLAANGAVPVLLIGPQEREVLDRLREAVPGALFPEATAFDPTLGFTRLQRAVALCRRLAAAVANDSGVGHLLGAIGTPLVSLFGPSDAARWAPFTACGVVVRAQDFGGSGMDAIPVDAAMRAIEQVLGRRDGMGSGPAVG